MERWEKEQAFSEAFSSGRYSNDLWKYIPSKLAESVADAYADYDGYWIILAEGYTAYDHTPDCGVIHEYNITDLREAIRTIWSQDL